jgi:hypothetical protein
MTNKVRRVTELLKKVGLIEQNTNLIESRDIQVIKVIEVIVEIIVEAL